jgi:hypothetical protein
MRYRAPRPTKRSGLLLIFGLATTLLLPACQQPAEKRDPPPDARRPTLKSQGELAAERRARIDSGDVVPTESPRVLGEERARRPQRVAPAPIRPTANAIAPDILMVDDAVLTVAEVLFPIRDEIRAFYDDYTARGFQERVTRLIRRQTQQQIGGLLVYAEAMSQLADAQREMFDVSIDKEIERVIARDYGGSRARLNAELATFDITPEQFRAALARSVVVRQYTREKLMPRIHARRDELLRYYRRNIEHYSSAATRELRLMEFPFAAYLPEGVTWEDAGTRGQAVAKLAAMRAARAADEALAAQPFAAVAREYDRGVHADDGGSWGMIGRPLQGPYHEASKLIFDWPTGRTSDPIETERGWCIVQCGEIKPAEVTPFGAVQDEIREELMERRFTKLSVDYVLRLADEATISAIDPFIASATLRATEWAMAEAGE